jgi:hypothetical protein
MNRPPDEICQKKSGTMAGIGLDLAINQYLHVTLSSGLSNLADGVPLKGLGIRRFFWKVYKVKSVLTLCTNGTSVNDLNFLLLVKEKK